MRFQVVMLYMFMTHTNTTLSVRYNFCDETVHFTVVGQHSGLSIFSSDDTSVYPFNSHVMFIPPVVNNLLQCTIARIEGTFYLPDECYFNASRTATLYTLFYESIVYCQRSVGLLIPTWSSNDEAWGPVRNNYLLIVTFVVPSLWEIPILFTLQISLFSRIYSSKCLEQSWASWACGMKTWGSIAFVLPISTTECAECWQ